MLLFKISMEPPKAIKTNTKAKIIHINSSSNTPTKETILIEL